jgi:hypothetical protein
MGDSSKSEGKSRGRDTKKKKGDDDRRMGIRKWENWLSTLRVCHRQVQRALDAPEADRDGECGLAVVATATMLEAYVNLHSTGQFADGAHLIPQHLLAPYGRLTAQQRYQLLPRFTGRVEVEKLAAYERHEIHETIGNLITLRNNFVHGNLHKWVPAAIGRKHVAASWNAALEVLLVLETHGQFRIPASRIVEYEAELAALKVSAS